MWQRYIEPDSVPAALAILDAEREGARIVAGATDLILELERGARTGVHTLVDITRLQSLDSISLDDQGFIHLGPLVTHNHCATSDLLRDRALPLARAAWEVGAPQIRNRGTVAGNLITASPANDTITPLIALEASVTLRSANGERTLPLSEFYKGVRKTVMAANEMLVDIAVPTMAPNQRGAFVKVALRRAQAISLVNVALAVSLRGTTVERANIALGAVAPTIVRATEAELYLQDRELSDAVIEEAAGFAMSASLPIDDLRGSAAFRREMVRIATLRALRSVRDRTEAAGMPVKPVTLAGSNKNAAYRRLQSESSPHPGGPIRTTINGRPYSFKSGHNKTLLRLLREEAGLTGTKEGCAEGECGACTVFLDGMAVMSCLVPAPRADGAEIVTIEGLSSDDRLHPLQQAFVEDGAVQCGYCTPGFIMSGAKLLEERPHPTRDEIGQALTGNLCRCTGYYKIIRAVEHASVSTA